MLLRIIPACELTDAELRHYLGIIKEKLPFKKFEILRSKWSRNKNPVEILMKFDNFKKTKKAKYLLLIKSDSTQFISPSGLFGNDNMGYGKVLNDEDKVYVLLRSITPAKNAERIVLHELGHILGIPECKNTCIMTHPPLKLGFEFCSNCKKKLGRLK